MFANERSKPQIAKKEHKADTMRISHQIEKTNSILEYARKQRDTISYLLDGDDIEPVSEISQKHPREEQFSDFVKRFYGSQKNV